MEPAHQAVAEDRGGGEQNAAEADGADGFGAMSLATDHHGIDDGHGHPAEFGEDERDGQTQHGARFFGDVVEEEAFQHGDGMRDPNSGSETKSEEGSAATLPSWVHFIPPGGRRGGYRTRSGRLLCGGSAR